jgi:L-xylulokinase
VNALARFLLGIDAGLTVTKSVLFDESGEQVGIASRRVPTSSPQPFFVERDQDELWAAVVSTVRDVVASSGIDPLDIVGIGVTAHGDGIYLVDADARPVAPGVVSLDSRARDIIARWERDGTSAAALQQSGQAPFVSTPAALLAWFSENAPEILTQSAYALPCKDVIKARLTGRISTDRTEASLSFVDYRTQEYSRDILDLFGISHCWRLLAPAIDSAEQAGNVSADAAAELGLPAGVPVAAGAHDVDCSAIGSGAVASGQFSLIAGTYSINQAISDTASVSPDWCARNFVTPGIWIHQAVSPSSATNMEWFVREICATTGPPLPEGTDPFSFIEREISGVEGDPDDVVYLPFLYGSPLKEDTSATFLGIRGWHTRGHLLRAVMQGIVYNHVWHIDDLLTAFDARSVHLTGGATNSSRWCQMFADALGREVRVSSTKESGALGVCLLAGLAVGLYADLDDAVQRAGGTQVIYRPTPEGVERQQRSYTRYRRVAAAMGPVWDATHMF